MLAHDGIACTRWQLPRFDALWTSEELYIRYDFRYLINRIDLLAMPVSWKGTLQQYAGRLHREHATKTDVRIIDFVDTAHPALLWMWEKRQRGYRAMGYRIAEPSSLERV